MGIDCEWEFVGVVPDGQSFTIGGLDVWKHKWKETGERIRVKDPLYHSEFIFQVYEIRNGEKIVTFAAGEFSNCMWGFYVRS